MKKITLLLMLFAFVLNAQVDMSSKPENSFLALQKITVTIGGDFFVTGSFPALATERVDEFLTRLYIEAKQTAYTSAREKTALAKVEEKFKEYSLRGIRLKRYDGSEIIIDLAKFRLNGDFKNNPYLKNGDVIILPKLDLDLNFIEINGAVNQPVKFQYVIGDRLSDAIILALGINQAYDGIEKAEISRLGKDGTKEEIILADISDDIELKRGDRIRILGDETQKRSFKVLVLGEVKNPGYIYVTRYGLSASEIIEKAGGFTDRAWLNNVELISGKSAELLFDKDEMIDFDSKAISHLIQLEQMKMSRLSNLSLDDTLYFQVDNKLNYFDNGRILDFKDTTSNNTFSQIVEDGEVIYVPKTENYVYVFGQVTNKGNIEFKTGEDYMYYINQAGGFSEEAIEDVMLIKGNTKNWISIYDTDSEIEPGDYLWVPKEPSRDLRYYLLNTRDFFSILGTVATIILLINQLTK